MSQTPKFNCSDFPFSILYYYIYIILYLYFFCIESLLHRRIVHPRLISPDQLWLSRGASFTIWSSNTRTAASSRPATSRSGSSRSQARSVSLFRLVPGLISVSPRYNSSRGKVKPWRRIFILRNENGKIRVGDFL